MLLETRIEQTGAALNFLKELTQGVQALQRELEYVRTLYSDNRISHAPATFSGSRRTGNWAITRRQQGAIPYLVVRYIGDRPGMMDDYMRILWAFNIVDATCSVVDGALQVNAHRD
jgi:hypothetical protein